MVLSALLLGCPDDKPATPPPSRFAGVASNAVAPSKLCDRTWPATGSGARPFRLPPTRPVEVAPASEPGKGWRWVNVWATWCAPCVEEMALLGKWKSALEKDGVALSFEMLSIDETAAEPALKTWVGRLPGALSWVQSPEDVPPWLESAVGVSSDAAIPIHIVVDPSGAQRCVRVGALHAQDYGAVRAMLSAPRAE